MNDPRNGYQPESEGIMPLLEEKTRDKFGLPIVDAYMARVERTVIASLTANTIRTIGSIEIPELCDEARKYWEKQYIVAWERSREFHGTDWGTHKVCINNEGESMLVWGHYNFKSANDAIIDMIKRSMFDLRYGVKLTAELNKTYSRTGW